MGGSAGWRLLWAAAGLLVAGTLLGLYVSGYIIGSPPSYTPAVQNGVVNLTLETVPSAGVVLSPTHPDWVAYLVRRPDGELTRTTVWDLPAHATIRVTIYNFDGASGLRNPLFAEPRGIVGRLLVDGRPVSVLDPSATSHGFLVPALGIVIPIPGVPASAKNQCGSAPCSLDQAHRTIVFTFRTGAPGHFRWQCFVPCAAGFLYGFGGPMQTIGYMDGFINVD